MFLKGYIISPYFHWCNKHIYLEGESPTLTQEKAFFRGFILKPTERTYVLLKKLYQGFLKVLCLRDRHVFRWQSLEVLSVFNTLTLKQIFWKTQTLFKELEYRFLVECTKIESTAFPYKTALSEANVNPLTPGVQ